jgi:hypothetical protein
MELKIGLNNEEMNLVQGALAIMVSGLMAQAKEHWELATPQSAEWCESRARRVEKLLYKLRNESKMEIPEGVN